VYFTNSPEVLVLTYELTAVKLDLAYILLKKREKPKSMGFSLMESFYGFVGGLFIGAYSKRKVLGLAM